MVGSRVLVRFAVAAASFLCAVAAHASPIIFTVDRHLNAFAGANSPFSGLDTRTNSSTGLWTDAAAGTATESNATASSAASQTSDILALMYGGSGQGSSTIETTDGTARGYAESYFFVVFQTDQAYDYSLSGALDAAGTGALAQAVLYSYATGTTLINVATTLGPLALGQTGTLAAGEEYYFLLLSLADNLYTGATTGTGSFNAFLTFTPSVTVEPIPEPASLLLFGTGALTVWRAARRRTKAKQQP